MRPRLSYSLGGYRAGDYLAYPKWLANLHELGFRWVSFMPTWLVHDEVPLRFATEFGPPLEELAEAVSAFVAAGFHIKLEPHLDWTHILGRPYEWRRRMYFDPSEQYAERVLAPLFGIAGEVERQGARCLVSLGSELAVSLLEFAPRWHALLAMFQTAYPRLAIGHNIDVDTLQPGTEIRNPLNTERARRGLPALAWREHRDRQADVFRYLGQLDYVGFSFYPNAKGGRSLAWWREQTTEIKARIVGRALLKEAQKNVSRLRRSAGERPHFVIGEFGIGSADPTRPYHTDSKSFLRPDGVPDAGAFELRRKYHAGLLECLRMAPHLFGDWPVTYWTVTHYDILGALEQPGSELFRDEILRDAVRRYNEYAGSGSP